MEKRILFTANLDSFFTKFLIPQLKWFKDHGYEVHIATKKEGIEIPYCDQIFNVDFARGLSVGQNIHSYKQMVEILNNNQYELISCHTPFGGAVTRLAAGKCRANHTRVVYMAHGFHFYKGASWLKNLLFYTAEKYLAKYTDAIITINREDYEIASTKFKTDVAYVEGVGLDPAKFEFPFDEEEKFELRKSFGIKKNDFVMIYPAELLPRKRQDWLLKTLAPLMKTHKDFHLLLPGNDSMNGYCQKLTQELELEEQVHFLGFRRDVPMLIKMSDLAVTAAYQEGLPVNVMEAIYVGLPVVATKCRGNSDLIFQGKNGYLVDLNDTQGFCTHILNVYAMTEEERNAIKEYDRSIIQQYLLKNVLEKTIRIYLGQ